MSFLDEIAARLVAQGVGVINTSIFMGSEAVIPPGDGPYISLVETGGTSPLRRHNSAFVRPSLQVLVRAVDYLVARIKSKAAYDALGGANGLHNVTLSGIDYVSLTTRQEPTDIGIDEAGRNRVAFNIDAVKLLS